MSSYPLDFLPWQNWFSCIFFPYRQQLSVIWQIKQSFTQISTSHPNICISHLIQIFESKYCTQSSTSHPNICTSDLLQIFIQIYVHLNIWIQIFASKYFTQISTFHLNISYKYLLQISLINISHSNICKYLTKISTYHPNICLALPQHYSTFGT